MPIPFALAASMIPQVIGLFTGGKQKREARKAAQAAQQNFDQSLGFANKGLANAQGLYDLSKTQYGGRMAGAGAMEQGIYGNQANTLASMGRNSTSAAQQLALAAGVQGNTNDAFGQLGLMEAGDKQNRFGVMANAGQGVQAAQGNLQNIYSQQSQMANSNAQQLSAAGNANQFNALNGIANTGLMYGMGGFGGQKNGAGNPGVTAGAGALQGLPGGFNPSMGMAPMKLPMGNPAVPLWMQNRGNPNPMSLYKPSFVLPGIN